PKIAILSLHDALPILATMLYRRQICSEQSVLESEHPVQPSSGLSNSSHKGSRTVKSRNKLEPQNTLSKITYESSTTSSGSGTGSDRKSTRLNSSHLGI